jgi:hypothetical protein
MITYEVSARVESEHAERYETYMKEKHLRDVLASGCFVDAALERAGPGEYRARYRATTQTDVDRYLRDHTAALRKDFSEHFPVGVQLEREIWIELVAIRRRT